MIPKIFSQCKAAVEASLAQSRTDLESTLSIAKAHMLFPPEYEDLKEEILEIHRALAFNFPKNKDEDVDTNAIFLRNNGQINLTNIERYRRQRRGASNGLLAGGDL